LVTPALPLFPVYENATRGGRGEKIAKTFQEMIVFYATK